MKLEHFNIEEFDCPSEPGSGVNMERNFLRLLDKARGIADVPFKINSGFRTVEHNTAVGGVNGSSHTLGWAADIHCTNSQARIKIVAALIEVGFRRIGVSKSFIHVDNDPSKVDSIWLY